MINQPSRSWAVKIPLSCLRERERERERVVVTYKAEKAHEFVDNSLVQST